MSKRWEEIHQRALDRFDVIWAEQEAERAECLDDRRFATIRGAQWDDEWGAQFENAPRMEVNKTHKELVRIFSDYRNNRISVDFREDEDGDPETADSLDGLYRADEEESDGQEAYDTAFDEGVGGGMGAWRLRSKYEDDSDPDNDHQRICFEPITDADQRVFFGVSKRQDKRDAKHAFLLTPITKTAFADEYGDKADTDFAKWSRRKFDWVADETIYLAEYYEVDEKKSVKFVLSRMEEEQTLIDPEPEEITDLEAQGWKIDRTRDIKKPRVTKYTMSGAEVLSEEEIAGPNIPIAVFYAKRWVIENIERCAGHTRYAKDPQRIYNAEVSRLAEIAAMSPLEKPIFDPEQVAGLEEHWAQGNIARHPYALARALRNEADGSVAAMGPIGKVEPPQVPAALAALVQVAGQDIAELTGASDQAEEVPANTSAKAIELVHTRADAKTFIYLDNFRKAMKRSGEIWLGMCSELYVEEGRQMEYLDEQGGRKAVTLAEPGMAKDGEQITRNDYTKGKFKVIVDVGPSSISKKDATVNALLGMAQAAGGDQELQNALISTALLNMEGEGLDDIQKWQRARLVRSGIVTPTEEEKTELAQEAANQQPDPNAALADGMTQQALAEAGKARAGTIKSLADAELVKAKTLETLAGMTREDRQQIIDAIAADADRLARTVPVPVQ